jgi:superkiller protein 3
LKLGRVNEGIAELEIATKAQPENLDAAYTLASAYLSSRRLAKAEAVIDGILRRHESAEAHLLAGSFYLTSLKYEEAVGELRRAQEMNPSLPELVSKLGEAYAMTGSREIAIQVFEKRLKTNPADFEALGFLGWLYLESDRLEEAAAALNRARQIKPDDADLLYQLGRLARAQEHFEAAAPLLERVVALRPEYTRAHLLLSQTYFRLNRVEEGKKEQAIANRLWEKDRLKRASEPAIRPAK